METQEKQFGENRCAKLPYGHYGPIVRVTVNGVRANRCSECQLLIY